MAGTTGVLTPLSSEELRTMDAYWRACNYLSAGMIYLRANPLLREPLKAEHIKNRLLGHWGSDPGQSFVWVHMNRLIKRYDLNVMYISGPGHGAPATLANCYLEGYYSEIYPDKSRDEAGMLNSFGSFPFPEESARTAPRRRRVRLTKAANLGTRSRTATERHSIIPISSLRSWLGMARRKPVRLRLPGTPTSFLIRFVTEPSCRCYTSTATRSPSTSFGPVHPFGERLLS